MKNSIENDVPQFRHLTDEEIDCIVGAYSLSQAQTRASNWKDTHGGAYHSEPLTDFSGWDVFLPAGPDDPTTSSPYMVFSKTVGGVTHYAPGNWFDFYESGEGK